MPGQPGQPVPPPKEAGPKKPKKGDFDAGGQTRFPSGPDEMGKYATWNWVAVDLKGQYFLLDMIRVYGNIPIALIKPDYIEPGGPGTGRIEPKRFGGFTATMEIKIPKIGPWAKTESAKKTDVGLLVTGAYMHEGAMILSDKDFPLFTGNFAPGLNAGLTMKVALGDVVDFSLVPVYVYQASGQREAQDSLQIPMSLILKVGDVVKLSAELGVFTGDDISMRAKNGGRLQTGGSLDVKIGPMLIHGGIGAASLITGEGSAYPTIRDSFYIDLNAKYAK